MNSTAYDIVILPNPLLADLAVSASQRLKQFDSYFVLKDGEYFPHLSLYMLRLKSEDLPKVEEMLSTIARVTSPLQLQASQYNQAWGYIDAEYEKFSELVGLQDEVIKTLSPIRDGMCQEAVEMMQKAEGLALENFQNYGYKYVGELFRPHMTLSRLKRDNSKALEVLGQTGDFNRPFMQLGLFEMGDNGTCVKKIRTFDLLV